MQMEAETLSMLIWGFGIVIIPIIIGIIALMIKRKNRSLLWFLGQIVFLGLSFNQFINLIQRKPEIPEVMMSENNSLILGMMGVFWALSMICMMLGIWFSSEDRR